MIEIKKECNFDILKTEIWSGAVDIVKTIIEKEKTEKLMQLLEDVFYDGIDITTVNDFLWFDRDCIFEQLERVDIKHKK